MANVLMHYGIKGMKWGVRRYRNRDGTLTSAGKLRYSPNELSEGYISPASINNVFKTTRYAGKPVEYCTVKERLIIKQKKPLTRAQHYYRNQLNSNLPLTEQQAKSLGWHTVIANAHQFTKEDHKNLKLVSPNGKLEAVYKRGHLITNPLDMGSYNYVPSEISYAGHFTKDIMPWIKYGNAPDDPSTEFERLNSILGHYTKGAKRKGLSYMNNEV